MSEPIHDFDCEEWCNHCTECGKGIMWGSLCWDHRNRFDGKVELTREGG